MKDSGITRSQVKEFERHEQAFFNCLTIAALSLSSLLLFISLSLCINYWAVTRRLCSLSEAVNEHLHSYRLCCWCYETDGETMREKRGYKKKIKSLLTADRQKDRRRDRQRGDERLEWTDTPLDGTRSRRWPATMSSTKKKHLSKWILSRNTSLVLFLSVCCPPGAPQRSGYMQAKTTWIHELPFFWFRLVRLCVCNFSKLFCSGWMMCSCADLLRRLFFTPISRPHSFFFPALDSFSSAWLSQLGCLMAFKWQHLSQQTAVIWLCFKHR